MRFLRIPSLRWRLVAVMVLAYLGVTFATLLASYRTQESNLQAQQRARARTDVQILAAGAIGPIETGASGALADFMRSLTQNSGVKFAAIIENGKVLASTDASKITKPMVLPFTARPTAILLPNGDVRGQMPILQATGFGEAVVIISGASTQRELQNSIFSSSVIPPILGLIIFVLLSLLISQYILGPLVDLARAARQLRQGDLGARISMENNSKEDNTELGDVAEAFNSMAASLEQRINHLSFLARSGAIVPNTLRTGGDVQPVVKEFCQLLGTSGAVLVSRHDSEQAIIGFSGNPEELSWWNETRQRAERANGPTTFLQGNMTVMVVPVLTDQIFMTARQGTQQFAPEERQVITNFAYQLAIAADNAELLASQQEALQVKDQFLSIVSHELRTPLTTIKGYAQMLRRKISGDPQAERFADNIDAQVGRLARLVDDLLDVTRFARQQFELMPQQMDLRAVLEDVTTRFRVVASTHKLDLLLDRGPFEGIWDHDRLEQVLNNLVSNAIKYSPNGGRVTITTRHENNHIVVAVRDQGMGIPEEDQENLFERFFRGRAEGQDVKGLGLGLYVTRRIIEAHGGQIWVSSKPGEGSVFSFSLPLQPEYVAQQPARAGSERA